MVACGRWACLVDPSYHAVLAVKVCALAGDRLRPAACGRLRTLTAALRRGAAVSANPARHRPEVAMSSSSTSSTDAVAALLVRDVDGQYRPARADEVLTQARRVLSQRVRRGATMSSPQAVKDYLLLEIGALEHGRHRRPGLLALGQNLRLQLGAVHAPLGFGLHRCPPVRIGGHHRHERTCDDQDGMAGRSRCLPQDGPLVRQ
jgi:hypothetical protein